MFNKSLVVIGTVMSIGVGAAAASASPPDVPVAASPEVAVPASGDEVVTPMAGCGLEVYSAGGGNWSYTIANCHTYGVNRRIIKSNGSRGSCRYIAPGAVITGTSSYFITGYEVC